MKHGTISESNLVLPPRPSIISIPSLEFEIRTPNVSYRFHRIANLSRVFRKRGGPVMGKNCLIFFYFRGMFSILCVSFNCQMRMKSNNFPNPAQFPPNSESARKMFSVGPFTFHTRNRGGAGRKISRKTFSPVLLAKQRSGFSRDQSRRNSEIALPLGAWRAVIVMVRSHNDQSLLHIHAYGLGGEGEWVGFPLHNTHIC